MPLREISATQITARLRVDNPWWNTGEVTDYYQRLTPRLYFPSFYRLVTSRQPHRAAVLMGPRRVGKTVLLFHVIQGLIAEEGVAAQKIIYLSLDTPIYGAADLDRLFQLCLKANNLDGQEAGCYVFYDEVQYLKDWEVHLKSLVDTYKSTKFIASGSAAAALRLKSQESGAGRFTDFSLPPLTFHEYIHLKSLNRLIQERRDTYAGRSFISYATADIDRLNEEFIRYINFGGYPEVSLSPTIQRDPARYLKSDIIDKVLQRDLPTLYGIQDVLELNRLFTTIAFNSGQEFSYDSLSNTSGVSKATIKRYINYLEAAFLIRVVHRLNNAGKRFTRATHFKIYLTNPSIRSGLFAPIKDGDEHLGSLVETAIFSQWFHRERQSIFYARWNKKGGEVDIVGLHKARLTPVWAVEIKWSNRAFQRPGELKALQNFAAANKLDTAVVTSKDQTGTKNVGGLELKFQPAALYCYTVGRRSLRD
jgi:predicted AAA+ superfamily ATPase